jgi:hypothetical protein
VDIPASIGKLTALFRKFGAPDPASWAVSWIDRAIEETARRPTAPYSSVGAVLKRCRERGISDQDETDPTGREMRPRS